MIVMKFGGTSVQDAKAIERAAAIVKGRAAQKPVVVVSAMAKVTDQLLTMARAAGNGDRKNALKLCRALQERHYNTAGELLGTALFTQFHSDLGLDFETLDELLRGIAAVGELTPRTTDYVSAFGEVLSSKIVTAAFSALGIDSALVDSRECIVTDTAHTRAAPLFEETNERLRTTVQPLLDSGKVPVMGGFIGSTKAGITTTIGRGGSDYSAAIVGAGLGAEKIEIWTDVDGMMTTDPSMCSDARRIKVISFDEAAELAYFGAKVLHPATVLPAVQKNKLAQSFVRRNTHYRPCPTLPKLLQSNCRKKTHHHRGRRRPAHAASSRFPPGYLRGVRQAPCSCGCCLDIGSERLPHRRIER